MKIQNNGYLSIEQLQNEYLTSSQTAQNLQQNTQSFQEILELNINASTNELKFSKHASNRLTDRNIELTQDQLNRLNEATVKASAKGINESLILMDSLAFIVNVPNSTVITAMDQQQTNEQIYTNIDGAVIV
ncbi:MAG: TIGR02530 family flagellar biosynthesis protein [Eubacteriales bacterium]